MPTSNLTLAPNIIAMAAEHHPSDVLDVGVGHGKYGVLVREYVRPVRLVGIEAEPRYLTTFPWLETIYDDVLVGDVCDYSDEFLADFDLVLMIDVLEHLDTADGAELLARIPGRVIICTPANYFQNPEHVEYPSESHRSLWSAEAIAAIRPLEVDDAFAATIGGVLVRTRPL